MEILGRERRRRWTEAEKLDGSKNLDFSARE